MPLRILGVVGEGKIQGCVVCVSVCVEGVARLEVDRKYKFATTIDSVLS